MVKLLEIGPKYSSLSIYLLQSQEPFDESNQKGLTKPLYCGIMVAGQDQRIIQHASYPRLSTTSHHFHRLKLRPFHLLWPQFRVAKFVKCDDLPYAAHEALFQRLEKGPLHLTTPTLCEMTASVKSSDQIWRLVIPSGESSKVAFESLRPITASYFWFRAGSTCYSCALLEQRPRHSLSSRIPSLG